MTAPAPWRVSEGASNRRVFMPNDVFEIRAADGGLVACLYRENWPGGGSMDAANARLLAAAPQLRDLVRSLGKCGSCGGSGKYQDKGFRGERGFVEELVTCKKCDGRGLTPEAAALLAQIEGEAS